MDGAKEGILPSITGAQAILESGWGSSELAKAPNNNPVSYTHLDVYKRQIYCRHLRQYFR